MSAEQRAANRNASKRARRAAAKLEEQHAATAAAEAQAVATIADVVASVHNDSTTQRLCNGTLTVSTSCVCINTV